MANATAMFAVQAQVFTTLNVAAVTNVFGGNPVVAVYDLVPEGKAFPYLEIGEIEELLDNTFNRQGRNLLVSIHVYSEAAGFLEAEKILEQVNILLDETLLPDPTGWHTQSNDYEIGTMQKEFDGVELRHGIARYRIRVTQ